MKTDDVARPLPPNHARPTPLARALFEAITPILTQALETASARDVDLSTVAVVIVGEGELEPLTGNGAKVVGAMERHSFGLVPRERAQALITEACAHCGLGFAEVLARCELHPGLAVPVHLRTRLYQGSALVEVSVEGAAGGAS